MLTRYLWTLAASIILSCSTASFAWDGAKGGNISGVEVTNAQNYGFRVYMDGTSMCGTAATWAYINKNWDNYEAMVSLLTSAYISGKTVAIYTTRVGEYCEIGHAAFH